MSGRWTTLAALGLGNLVMTGAVVTIVAASRRSRRQPTAPDTDTETLRINIELCGGPGYFTSGLGADEVTRDDFVSLIHREADELTLLVEDLYGMLEFAGHEQQFAEEAFVRLDDLRWLLGSYVIKGGRTRRLVALPELLTSIDLLDSAGAIRRRPALGSLRSTALELLKRIHHTNGATADWLMTHRIAIPDPDCLDSNALLSRFDRFDVEPTSVSADPLYLLTCHIHDLLEAVECSRDVEHRVLDTLEAQLSRIITAVESEIRAALAFNTTLIFLAREIRSADAA